MAFFIVYGTVIVVGVAFLAYLLMGKKKQTTA
jgi:hypothetical protein